MELKAQFSAIDDLISPLSGQVSSFEHILIIKTGNVDTSLLEDLADIDELLNKRFLVNTLLDSPWVRFLRMLLHRLYVVKKLFENDGEFLLSLSEEKTLKASVEIVICVGILSHINKGIGIPLEQRLSNKFYLNTKIEHHEQKLYLLNFSLHGLMSLYESPIFQTILSSKHLGDLIAANFQLILEKQAVDSKLCSTYLKKLIEDTYQPIVIRELMVMIGNKDIPKKLYRWLSNILSDRLTSSGGLIATLRAVLDLTGDSKDSPRYWDQICVLAKLLTAQKHSVLYPELLELLKGENNEYRQVAVMSLKLLSETRPEDCNKYFVLPLLSPLIRPSTESEMSISLECIHVCCGISAPWTVSSSIFKDGFTHLLKLHAKTISSISYLKSKLSDIAHSILADEKTDIKETFDAAVFENLNVTFHFGSEGGIYTDIGSENIDPENVADAVLQLVLSYENRSVKVKFFKMLIESIIENKELVKQIIYTKLLSEICNDSDVQKFLGDDPCCLIPFIKGLLDEPHKFSNEIVCLGLMVLGVIIDTPPGKRIDWSIFQSLVEPLKNFKSSSCETNVLANELYELILSRGVLRKKLEKEKNTCTSLTKALEECVDPLLPVRAHGLRELGKLIRTKDHQALEKMDTILFIFKENLKVDDSYVYLSAVEGLASLAYSFPDEILTSLIEEYISMNQSTENRLKVGEVLLKLGRFLNEMAVVYKKELIGCFLIGCRGEDELMRASSLSNLGELCKILSFRISSYIMEILECIKAIYETDKFPEPRRAAVMVLTLLFKGLGEEVLKTLEPVLLEIYRGLKQIYEYDKDDVTRLHAQMALEELRASTITFLFPTKPLKKRIFVLDAPM